MTIQIFLADDHAVMRDGLRALIETHPDLRVIGDTANGRDALRLVQELKPDLVLMDIGMPELNGIDATQQIRATCPATRVIILSMHRSGEHILRAFQAGAQGYLLKESAGSEVITAVHAVCAGQRYLSQPIASIVLNDYLTQSALQPPAAPLAQLSARERAVMQLLVEGKSNTEIANLLALSPKSVSTYRNRLMTKLNIADLPGLTRFALAHGLIENDSALLC